MSDEWKNKLYYGDNLEILRKYIADESVDLIYLDPPFNSQATYNVLYEEKDGSAPAAQVKAFDDFWHWDEAAEATFHELVRTGPQKLVDLVQALLQFLGRTDMMAYLTMMAIRLVELHRVLKPTGSIYLHCDPTACHYLKIVMDAVFGPRNFRNQIVWKRQSAHSDARWKYADVTDVLLFYAKSDKAPFRAQYRPHDPSYVAKFYRFDDHDGRGPYRLDNMASPNPRPRMMYEWMGFPPPAKGWRYQRDTMEKLHSQGRIYYPRRADGSLDTSKRPALKRYLAEQEGSIVTNIWDDIQPLHSAAAERLGYPTQKPEALLERILNASSNPEDVVLDPFCGCGTTVAVAERLKRRWIGIDITHLAIALMRHRLEDTFKSDLCPYEVIGVPQDLKSAEALAEQDKYQFQWWALSLVDARPYGDQKKGADSGIDGYVYFFDDAGGKPKKIVVQVKAGHVNVSQIRDLKGVMAREQAELGAFITFNEPTAPMKKEALAAGFYEPEHFPGLKFPRIQILTIEELLAGKKLEYPRAGKDAWDVQGEGTFKRAKRKGKPSQEQMRLL